jgi:hypothetical protein
MAVGVVHGAIENGVGIDRITDEIEPFVDGDGWCSLATLFTVAGNIMIPSGSAQNDASTRFSKRVANPPTRMHARLSHTISQIVARSLCASHH